MTRSPQLARCDGCWYGASTPFPTKVITPPNGNVKYGSILNDLVPMVGLEYAFGAAVDRRATF